MQNPSCEGREWETLFKDGEQILDIRYDQVFKAVFTRDTEKSRLALSDLISSLIGRTVTAEAIINNEPPVNDTRTRHVRFDVPCKTEKGELINVEMSFNPKSDELARLEYYTAVLFTGQNIRGKNKNYNILKETCQIAIIAKRKFYNDERLVHNFLLYDPDASISFGGKTRIITVELVKTKPIVDKPVEKMSNAELWAVFFEYLTDEQKRSKIKEILNCEEGIAMAANTLGSLTKSEKEFFKNMYKLKQELDYQSEMTWATRKARKKGFKEGRIEGLEEGREEGLEKGLKEGREKGLEEGLEEGREEGREKANLENAKKMKSMGFSLEQIQAVTGLSAETISLF